jgi:LysR family transcriptional regulator, glycine cleavage system transcriptional activator
MTSHRIPPTNWLRTFDLVAHHLSFTQAADVLCISPSAVSQQVKRLEEFFGFKLFRRVGNKLCLTDAAEDCLPMIHEAFSQLQDAVDQLNSIERGGSLNVSVAPSFASKWLLDRLSRAYARNPATSIEINSTVNLATFENNDIDVAIRYGNGTYPGLEVQQLMPESIVMVASPDLINTVGGMDRPEDLKKVLLLHDTSPDFDRSCPEWRDIAENYRLEGFDWFSGLRFNQSALVVESAIRGVGVGLAKYALTQDALESGQLVNLFDIKIDVNHAYYVLYLPEKKNSKRILNFVGWLQEEAGRSKMACRAGGL